MRLESGEYCGSQRRLLWSGNFKDLLAETLKGDTWDLVHYVGHSLFHLNEGKGYIFFPDTTESDAPIPVPIEDFGAQLNRARFLYLSSCQSAQGSFLASVAQCRVPSLLGFSCPVPDTRAAEFALEFYKQLFGFAANLKGASKYERDKKCLQHAFQRTQEIFFKTRPAEPIWAQPILMLQSD